MTRKAPRPMPNGDWPIVDNAHLQLRPAAAGGPYEHRFVGGACRVCGYREGAGEVGCPCNVGTVFSSGSVGNRGR